VVGPIGEEGIEVRDHADWVLKGMISPILEKLFDFEVKRADHDPCPGLIDVHLIGDLLDADLVIADLSFTNPNVFYESGIRHMAQKPIIHLQRDNEKIPFDVSLYRAIKFSRDKFDDFEKAKTELNRQVNAVLANGYQVENPVTRARGQLQLRQDATPQMRLVADYLENLENRVTNLETIAVAGEDTYGSPIPSFPLGQGVIPSAPGSNNALANLLANSLTIPLPTDKKG
jgi:hypothetical protein